MKVIIILTQITTYILFLSIKYFSIRFVWPERIHYLYAVFTRLEDYNDRIEPQTKKFRAQR